MSLCTICTLFVDVIEARLRTEVTIQFYAGLIYAGHHPAVRVLPTNHR